MLDIANGTLLHTDVPDEEWQGPRCSECGAPVQSEELVIPPGKPKPTNPGWARVCASKYPRMVTCREGHRVLTPPPPAG